MSNSKYELMTDKKIDVFGRKLFRIRALNSFGSVNAGDEGGYVESESNLSDKGNAWVSGDAWVYGDAWVSDDAWVYGDARVSERSAIFWASNVGSEFGTLNVFRCESGIGVRRGCFFGTPEDFLAAVEQKHGADSKIGREYHLLMQVALSRVSE